MRVFFLDCRLKLVIMTVCNLVAQAFKRLVTWLLISSLCVSSALANNDEKILREMELVSQSYGITPNVYALVDLAYNSTRSPGILQSADSSCQRVITLTDPLEHSFNITNEPKFCSAFFQTNNGSKLTFEFSGLDIYPCDEEYLYINDGATLESTLCDGNASFTSRGSRFLFVQYGRQTKTGTAFNITVKAVPDLDNMPEVSIRNKLLEQSFMDGQICSDCGYTSGNTRSPRILGGYTARVTESPWMVGVHITRRTTDPSSGVAIGVGCGASILDRRHILTAAHCIQSESTNKYPRVAGLYVVAGSDLGLNVQKADVNAQKIEVEDWVAHPSYNPDLEQGKSYDIAVLRLAEKLQFNDRVAPVCLAAPLDFLGSDVTVTGYGFVLGEGGAASQLQAVKLSIRPGDACQTTFKHANANFVFQSHQVCIYSPSKDACQGDSGGPAVLKWLNRSYQIGVVSFGLDCQDENIRMRHGGYTRVSSFIPWIKSVIQNNSTC